MTANHNREDAERLYLLVRHVGRKLTDMDAACGLSPARFSVLVNLAFHGIDNVGALAKSERVSRPAMTRLVRDMAAVGLVRTRADRRDRRGVLVELTKKGSAIVDVARKKKIDLVAAHLGPLDGDARDAVRRTLDALETLGALD